MASLELVEAAPAVQIIGPSLTCVIILACTALVWPASASSSRLASLNVIGSILWTVHMIGFLLIPTTVDEQASFCGYINFFIPYILTEAALFSNRIQAFYPMNKNIQWYLQICTRVFACGCCAAVVCVLTYDRVGVSRVEGEEMGINCGFTHSTAIVVTVIVTSIAGYCIGIVGIVTVIRFIRSKTQHSKASRHNFNIVKLMLVRDKDDVGFGIDFSRGKIGFDQFVDAEWNTRWSIRLLPVLLSQMSFHIVNTIVPIYLLCDSLTSLFLSAVVFYRMRTRRSIKSKRTSVVPNADGTANV